MPERVRLRMWVIYDHPRDFPKFFVVRGWDIDAAGHHATNECFLASSLEDIRGLLPEGLMCIPRQPGDDPVIVEVWM